jgi:hypothetical protein
VPAENDSGMTNVIRSPALGRGQLPCVLVTLCVPTFVALVALEVFDVLEVFDALDVVAVVALVPVDFVALVDVLPAPVTDFAARQPVRPSMPARLAMPVMRRARAAAWRRGPRDRLGGVDVVIGSSSRDGIDDPMIALASSTSVGGG